MKQGQIKFGTGRIKELMDFDGINLTPQNPNEQPPFIALGYDEQNKEWRKVKYFSDSNRFFDFNGAVYPIDRMNKWREI